jgi:hypothetical protein
MKNSLSVSLIASLAFVSLAQAGGYTGTCHWKGHPVSNNGNTCQLIGAEGDTLVVSALSGVKVTVKNSNGDQSDFDGTANRARNKEGGYATTHMKFDNIDYLQFYVGNDPKSAENLVLVDPDLLSKQGSGSIFLRKTPGDGGCWEAVFVCDQEQ